MIDPASQVLLREIVRRESRSLLQYAREVPLWAAPAKRPTLARLHEIARTERYATDGLATWLQRTVRGNPASRTVCIQLLVAQRRQFLSFTASHHRRSRTVAPQSGI